MGPHEAKKLRPTAYSRVSSLPRVDSDITSFSSSLITISLSLYKLTQRNMRRESKERERETALELKGLREVGPTNNPLGPIAD